FDIQIDGIRLEVQFRLSSDVNLALSESECSQSMRMRIWFGSETLGLPSCTEGIGRLRDGENAFAMLLLPFFFSQARQQDQLILLDSELVAASLKLTLGAMFIQN